MIIKTTYCIIYADDSDHPRDIKNCMALYESEPDMFGSNEEKLSKINICPMIINNLSGLNSITRNENTNMKIEGNI